MEKILFLRYFAWPKVFRVEIKLFYNLPELQPQ